LKPYSGRAKGQPIVYTSEHPALAMLETLVHINSGELPNAWLAEMSSEILQVSSAIMPHAANYLINPLHPEVRHITIIRAEKYEFDQRLK